MRKRDRKNLAAMAEASRLIAEECERRTGQLRLCQFGLDRLPDSLSKLGWLTHLNCSSLMLIDSAASDFGERSRQGFPIYPGNALSDLSPLEGLTALTWLNCSCTEVADLRPLAGLGALEELLCSHTHIPSLQPLAGLSMLRTLDCSYTDISDLWPLAGLIQLTTLICSATLVTDLTPLADLTALTTFECAGTEVAELLPLAGLTALKKLVCSGTRVTDLQPLVGLTSLEWLDCEGTQVTNLAPLTKLPLLKRLDCHGASITHLPEALIASSSLEELYISAGPGLAAIPPEVLSQGYSDDCLPRLRAHLADLETGAEPLPDVKVFVLGNGHIGKTQLCRRLRGEAFELDADSTHGIGVTTAELVMPDGPPALLNLWDFGGQDLYHGTHALFMQTRAVFVVLWTPDSEQGAHEHGGLRFENRPLGYWLDYVRHLGGEQSPLLVVQNKCDGGLGRRPSPPDSPALQMLSADGRCFQLLGYSAKDETGRDALLEALRLAVTALRRLQGQPLMATNRIQVRDQLRAWRDADAALPDTAERRHRLLPFADFDALCEQHGVHDPAGYAEVLHRAGEFWYQPGHFGDRMILDQSWAMREVYALFTREDGVYEVLRGPGLAGRFTRPLLDRLLWGRPSAHRDPLTDADQRVLLGLMEQSGICFVHRRGSNDRDATEYVAPDLLPDRATVATRLAERWDLTAGLEQEAAFCFPFLSPAIARTLLSDLGSRAGDRAIYWCSGLSLYDAGTRASAEIEARPDATGYGGRLNLRAKGDGAAALLRTLIERIGRLNKQCNWSGQPEWPAGALGDRDPPSAVGAACGRDARHANGAGVASPSSRLPAGLTDVARLRPTRPPPTKPARPEVYISYAWAREDANPLIDGLIATLHRHDIQVLRERDEMNWGDSIAAFMERLSAGRCVLVVLSADYLRSPFCMTELHGIWDAAHRQDEAFRRRIVPLVQDDASIRTLAERIAHARHWAEERKRLDDLLRDYPPSEVIDLIGALGHAEWARINAFSRHIVPMLTLVNDMLVPRQPELLAKDDYAPIRALIDQRVL